MKSRSTNANTSKYFDITVSYSEKPKSKKVRTKSLSKKNHYSHKNKTINNNSDTFLEIPYLTDYSNVSCNRNSSHSYDNCTFCNSRDNNKSDTSKHFLIPEVSNTANRELSSITHMINSNENFYSLSSSDINNNKNESVEIVNQLENKLHKLHSVLFTDNNNPKEQLNNPQNIKIIEKNIIIEPNNKLIKVNENENVNEKEERQEEEKDEKQKEEEENNYTNQSLLSFDYPISSFLTTNSIESIKQYLLSINNKETEKKNILNSLKIILLDLLQHIEKILNPEICKDERNETNEMKVEEDKTKTMSNEELILKINELNEIINEKNERIKELESSKKSSESLEYEMIKTRQENEIKLKEIKNDLEYEYYNKRKELEKEYTVKYDILEKENFELKERIKINEDKKKNEKNVHTKEIEKEKEKNETIIKEYETTISNLENKLKLLNESHEKYITELKEYYEKEIESMVKPDKINKMVEYKCNSLQEELYNNNKIIIERLKNNYEKKIKDLTEFYENKNQKKKNKIQPLSIKKSFSCSLPESTNKLNIINEIKNTTSKSLSNTANSDISNKTNKFSSSHNSTKTCIKCGLNDFLSPNTCTFHPFLAKGGGTYVYGKEWTKCKDEHHNIESKGCYTRNFHVYENAKTRLSSKFNKSSDDSKSEISVNTEESNSDKDEVEVLKVKTNKAMVINENGKLDF